MRSSSEASHNHGQPLGPVVVAVAHAGDCCLEGGFCATRFTMERVISVIRKASRLDMLVPVDIDFLAPGACFHVTLKSHPMPGQRYLSCAILMVCFSC